MVARRQLLARGLSRSRDPPRVKAGGCTACTAGVLRGRAPRDRAARPAVGGGPRVRRGRGAEPLERRGRVADAAGDRGDDARERRPVGPLAAGHPACTGARSSPTRSRRSTASRSPRPLARPSTSRPPASAAASSRRCSTPPSSASSTSPTCIACSTATAAAPASRPSARSSSATRPARSTRAACSRSSSLELCDAHGIPRPLVNAIVAGRRRDFFWPDVPLVVEADSYRWHRSPGRLTADRRPRRRAHARRPPVPALLLRADHRRSGRTWRRRRRAALTRRARAAPPRGRCAAARRR